jgi:hypothetical protein
MADQPQKPTMTPVDSPATIAAAGRPAGAQPPSPPPLPPPPPPPLTQRAQAVALTHFEHVERQVQLAATKASLIVAAVALMLNAYVKVANDYEIFFNLDIVAGRWFMLGGVLLIVGLIAALLAVFPKTWSRSPYVKVLYYASVAATPEQRYIDVFYRKTDAALDEELLREVYGKSRWLRCMFFLTSLSIGAIVLGIAICVLVLVQHGHCLPGLAAHKDGSAPPAPHMCR